MRRGSKAVRSAPQGLSSHASRPENPLPPLSGLTLRQRFTLIASLSYIVLGLIIVVRSLVAVVIPLAVLGIVLIALGIVRIRDFVRWRRPGSAG